VNVHHEVFEVFEGTVGEHEVDICSGTLETGAIHLKRISFPLTSYRGEGKCCVCGVPQSL
jgi:hypothetical protein